MVDVIQERRQTTRKRFRDRFNLRTEWTATHEAYLRAVAKFRTPDIRPPFPQVFWVSRLWNYENNDGFS